MEPPGDQTHETHVRSVGAGDRFVDAAVGLICEYARRTHAAGREFRLSLCGGSTPQPVYAALAHAPIEWQRVLITFGDERDVPPDHPDSNFRMAHEALLKHVAVPESQVLRIEAEHGAREAAARCDAALRQRARARGETVFTHDLVLLGMGDDGHTASLFPNTPALAETRRWVTENPVPKLGVERITMTLPLINAAAAACFLVTGEENKRPVVERCLQPGADDPAARVRPAGSLTWLLGWD